MQQNLTPAKNSVQMSFSEKKEPKSSPGELFKKQNSEQDFKVKYKTEMCKNWAAGHCEFGNKCAFAHGYDELRKKLHLANNYKTKNCKQFFEQGYCMYGQRCQFKHMDIQDTASSSPATSPRSQKGFDSFQPRRLPIFLDLEFRGI